MDIDSILQLKSRLTDGVSLKTIYADDESRSFVNIEEMVLSSDNIEYLTKMIIGVSDPLRNSVSIGQHEIVLMKVKQLLESWRALGKFDEAQITFENKKYQVRTVSPFALLDHYNQEFVNAFASTILPFNDVTKVTSVTNPNGLYAQQERIIRINSKPTPFYQRAVTRRLHDKKLDDRIDEKESFFYMMDKNPRISDQERKKRDVDFTNLPSYLDRQDFHYRMKPNY